MRLHNSYRNTLDTNASRLQETQAVRIPRSLPQIDLWTHLHRAFVARFGEDAFIEYYLPQHELLGQDYLPGLISQYKRDALAEAPKTSGKSMGGGGAKKKVRLSK